MVNRDHNRIKALLSEGKIRHKVDSNRAKKARGTTFDRVQRRIRWARIHLKLLARAATINVMFHEMLQARPVIGNADTPCSREDAWVSCTIRVMMIRDDPTP